MCNRKLIILFILLILITGCTSKSETSSRKSNKPILYGSEKFGFTLEFPACWDGYYIVHEYEESIQICFIGQSETSRQLFEDSDRIQGLPMFNIGNESCVNDGGGFMDGIYEIGESRGEKYYYLTGTDYPLGSLQGENIEDKEEKKLAENDLIKAKEMENDIKTIMSTFKGLY